MKISYCVTAKNEHAELTRLLTFLRDNIREQDEVIIQLDSNHTKEMINVIDSFTQSDMREAYWEKPMYNLRAYTIFPLNGDFASFKNNLAYKAVGDFIFQIDADEVPHQNLIQILPDLIEHNPTVEVFLVPRINTVKGLTQEHINKWGWQINEKGWVNFPDYQYRIYKNCPEIRWKNRVHEVLEGQKQFTLLPQSEPFCLYHEKSIQRQEIQNEFYSTL